LTFSHFCMATQIAPAPNIGSQIERALIAYLKQAFGDEAANYNFYFSNDWKVRVPPLIDVLAHKSTETVPHTRNESYQVRIEAKWKGNNEAGQENPDANWVEINAFVGVVMAALSVTDSDSSRVPVITALDITTAGRALATVGSAQDQVNNADMAAFTCEAVEFRGSQRAEAAEGSFFIKEVRNFEIRACNSNVS
jgi:hypothetical protein